MTTPHSTNSELVEVLLLTQAMLASAESGDWVVVTSLQRQRQALLEKFTPTAADTAQIKDILAADERISAYGNSARKTLERAWDELKLKRTAVDAYTGAKGPVTDS